PARIAARPPARVAATARWPPSRRHPTPAVRKPRRRGPAGWDRALCAGPASPSSARAERSAEMPLLTVYSVSGQPNRDITIPGRSPFRPFGAIRIASNSGKRQESDWPAIKAAIAAGDVAIELSHYEVEALPE